LLNLNKGNHHFFRSLALVDLQVQVIGGNACDPLAGKFPARGFDGEHHISISIATDHTKEARELGFKETAVERKLAALKGSGGRESSGGLFWLRVCQFQPACL